MVALMIHDDVLVIKWSYIYTAECNMVHALPQIRYHYQSGLVPVMYVFM